MRDLLVAVPSRGRPESITRLWDAMDATCRGDTTLVVGLDEDDPCLLEYPDPGFRAAVGFECEIGAGLHQVVAWINELVMPRAEDYRFVASFGDDHVPRTDGWDVALMEALGKTPFAFGNDLYPRAAGELPTHIAARSQVARALGYLAVPSMRHMWCDVTWADWGKACGITYLHDTVIEHLHYSNGKSPADATYAASASLMGRDEAAYRAYCADPEGLAADIDRIRSVL